MAQKIAPGLAITFDVEEWTIPQECNVKSEYNQNTNFSRVGCLRILRLFEKYSIKATFFVTGYFAEKERDLVRLLCAEGHEVACHGYCNTNLSDLKNDAIFAGISKAIEFLSGNFRI